jgi:hypothetical protein
MWRQDLGHNTFRSAPIVSPSRLLNAPVRSRHRLRATAGQQADQSGGLPPPPPGPPSSPLLLQFGTPTGRRSYHGFAAEVSWTGGGDVLTYLLPRRYTLHLIELFTLNPPNSRSTESG